MPTSAAWSGMGRIADLFADLPAHLRGALALPEKSSRR